MGLLQPYIGRYVSAPSASEVLDAQAVFDGCDAVEREILKITGYAARMKVTAGNIDSDALSIDGETIGPITETYYAYLTERESAIETSVEEIRTMVEQQYNRIQQDYNETAQRQDLAAGNGES